MSQSYYPRAIRTVNKWQENNWKTTVVRRAGRTRSKGRTTGCRRMYARCICCQWLYLSFFLFIFFLLSLSFLPCNRIYIQLDRYMVSVLKNYNHRDLKKVNRSLIYHSRCTSTVSVHRRIALWSLWNWESRKPCYVTDQHYTTTLTASRA